MYISLLRTTSDPEQLRTLAIAMVQKVMAENAELQNRIRIWEEQLKLTRQQRFGKKCESLAGMQRSLFEEDVDADIAEISAHLDRLLPQSGDEEKTTTRPVRKPLPSHLPRIEKVILPAEAHCPECDETLHFIRNEVSEKMEYIPAQVVVHRYVRPQYSCPCCEKVFSGKMPAHILPKSAVEPSVICFDSQTGRALRYPEAWLKDWHGSTLVSDGYSVYKSLVDNHSGITSACC